MLVQSRKPLLKQVSKTPQSIIDFKEKKEMGQTVFCLFCILSLSFKKLPGRQIKKGTRTSACAVPLQRTSVRGAKELNSLHFIVSVRSIMQHHVLCRTLQKTKVATLINAVSQRNMRKKKKRVNISVLSVYSDIMS